MKDKIICWDLDYTLGEFSILAIKQEYGIDSDEFKSFAQKFPFSVRYGMAETLEKLLITGHTNVVTTSATKKYAEEALRKSKLRPYFAEVFGRSKVCKDGSFGKDYLPVAHWAQIDKDHVSRSMLVIGDAIGDKPRDIDDLVFLHDATSPNADPVIISRTITALENTDNNYKTAFDALYEQGQKIRSFRGLDLGGGLRISLEYTDVYRRTRDTEETGKYPVIVLAPDLKIHQKPLVQIT